MLSGEGHVPQVPQWHDASVARCRRTDLECMHCMLTMSSQHHPYVDSFWHQLKASVWLSFSRQHFSGPFSRLDYLATIKSWAY